MESLFSHTLFLCGDEHLFLREDRMDLKTIQILIGHKKIRGSDKPDPVEQNKFVRAVIPLGDLSPDLSSDSAKASSA